MGDTNIFDLSSSGLFVLEPRGAAENMKPLISQHIKSTIVTHVSRQTDFEDIVNQDLVITMTRDQRLSILDEAPRLMNRVFVLLEMPRLIEVANTVENLQVLRGLTQGERVRAFARIMSTSRSLVEMPAKAESDDVADPYGKSFSHYENSVQQMLPALNDVARTLLDLAALASKDET
jgi:protein-tyrosine phosphatase